MEDESMYDQYVGMGLWSVIMIWVCLPFYYYLDKLVGIDSRWSMSITMIAFLISVFLYKKYRKERESMYKEIFSVGLWYISILIVTILLIYGFQKLGIIPTTFDNQILK
jgi:FtsH-binding integral membrane protein